MRAFLLIFAVWQVCAAGRLQIVLPDDHFIDKDHTSFNSKSLLEFNKKALGMKTGPHSIPTVTGAKLFEKPKALLVISIKGLDDFAYDGHMFKYTDNFDPQVHTQLKDHFGDGMVHVDVNSSGIFGPAQFKRNTDSSTLQESANQDIQNMHTLAKIIKEKNRMNANVVDYYRIHLDVSNARGAMEKRQLEENVKKGIDTLQDAIKDSYGGNVISEIYTHEVVTEKELQKHRNDTRSAYNVGEARFPDYPATFAISFFVSFAFIFGTMSMVWFMFDEGEMGKNSLVYRLSTNRQKKE